MKLRLLLTAVMPLFLGAAGFAQEQGQESWQVRHVGRQRGNRVVEAAGVLDLSASARELRFTTGNAAAWVLRFDAIRALHVEKDKHHYLVVHFTDRDGDARYETFRIDADDLAGIMSAFERVAGLSVDRTDKRQSFLGVPIRAAVGDRVEIRPQAGEKIAGKVLFISPDSLTIAPPQGPPKTFVSDDIARVRFVRTREQNAARGLWTGALLGAGMCAGFVVAGSAAYGGGTGTSVFDGVFPAAGICSLMMGGIGAALGAAIPPGTYQGSKDVYVKPKAGHARAQVSLAPQVGSQRRALMISVQF